MRSSILMLLLLGASQLAGCSSLRMTLAANQTLPVLNPNESRIVFMRSTAHGDTVEAGMYEVVNDKPEFIGILANDTKLFVDTTPGEHVFATMGKHLHFIKATVLKGKTYYVQVVPQGGAVIDFVLHPFRINGTGEYTTRSKEFNDLRSNTVLVEVSPEAMQWARDMAPRVRDNIMVAWPQWLAESDSVKINYTLNPGDGL